MPMAMLVAKGYEKVVSRVQDDVPRGKIPHEIENIISIYRERILSLPGESLRRRTYTSLESDSSKDLSLLFKV